MIIDELTQVFGFDIDDSDVKKFKSTIAATTAKFAAFTAGAVVAATAVSSLLSAASETAGASRFAKSIDVAFDALQRLEFAGKDVGVAVGSVRSALDGLRRAARGAATGLDEGAIASFAHLRVNVRDASGELKSADRLLLEIADSVANAANPELAFQLAEQLGLGTDLNLLLRLGADGIRGLGNEAERLGLILSNDAAKSSEEFAKKMDRLRSSGRALLVTVGLPLVEWINSLVGRFQAFRQTDAGQAVIAGLGTALGALGTTLALVLEPFKILAALWEEFPGIALLAAPALWAIVSPLLAAAAPIIATTAALAAMLAALNDIRVFFQGGESLIGKGLEALGFDQGSIREGIRGGFLNKVDQANAFFGSIADIGVGRSLSSGLIPQTIPAVASAGGAPAPAGGTFNQTVDIRVSGADNPGVVAQRVKRALQDQSREDLLSILSPGRK